MATFGVPRHGVSLSDALKQAATYAPISRPMLHTFELYHPLGTPAGAIYVVNDFQAFSATKEATAARDAGATVQYLACSVAIARPEESDNAGSPEIALTVKQVSGLMSDALRLARGSLVPWVVIERIYAADDTSGPAILPPMQLYVTGVDMDGETLTLRASFGDSVNVSVPRVTFKRKLYPGLVR